MVHLRQTGCQFSASWTGPGDNDQWFFGLDIFVGPVSLVADDKINIGWIAFGVAMGKDLKAASFKSAGYRSG